MGIKLDRVVIIGAGISGLITAIALRKSGYEVAVYDKTPEPAGPSDSIGLWPEANLVLKDLGLLELIMAKGSVINQVELRNLSGEVLNRLAPDKLRGPLVCIHGTDLYAILLAALPASCIHTNKKFLRYNDDNEVIAYFEDGSTVTCDLLIGADGLNSKVREQLANDGKPAFRDYMIWHGALNYDHPGISEHAATEVLGNGKRFGIIPLGNGRIGWWATANESLKNHQHMSGRKKKLAGKFGRFYDPIPSIINATEEEDIIKTPVYGKSPLTRWHEGRVCLLGDAAHPVTPGRGQGACLAIEDAGVLENVLSSFQDLYTALTAYESQRATRTGDISRESFRHGEIGQWENRWAVMYRTYMIRRMAGNKPRPVFAKIFDYTF